MARRHGTSPAFAMARAGVSARATWQVAGTRARLRTWQGDRAATACFRGIPASGYGRVCLAQGMAEFGHGSVLECTRVCLGYTWFGT